MCISPVGIVNACRPAQAALQAYNLAGLIHVHDVGFCQDGAASMAAAVAEAMNPRASIDSVLQSATDAIVPLSGREMLERIDRAMQLARRVGDYRAFREAVYAQCDDFFCGITCDSRETIPFTLALLWLAEGDLERCVTYAANLGRDADTIGTMCGAVAGALGGVEGIRSDWVDKAQQVSGTDQQELADKLANVAIEKYRQETEAQSLFGHLVQ